MRSVTTEIWKNDSHWEKLNQARIIATEEAHKSPCVRRKYGSILSYPNWYMTAHNNRVTRCCDDICIREFLQVNHGHNTDLGAEIHSEQSLLLKYPLLKNEKGLFLIVGFDNKDNPYYGKECWPCYSCARMIKEAGIKSVWVPLQDEGFGNYIIDYILESYEQELIGSLGDF